MTILSTYSPFIYTLRSWPPHGHLRVLGQAPRHAWTAVSEPHPPPTGKEAPVGVVLQAPSRVRAPTELQPGTAGTRCLLDRSGPRGAPNRRSPTFSDQGGPAASEANSTPRPLGRSSQNLRGTRRLPASVHIFLHLDRAPRTNRNRKPGRCHRVPSEGAGMSGEQLHQWCLEAGARAGLSRRPS